jgi:hypothetical protein
MTIHKYAIEPEILLDLKDFQILLQGLGVEHGRVMIEFPKKWKVGLFDAANSAYTRENLKLVLFTELMKQLTLNGNRCVPSGFNFESNLSWRDNARTIANHLKAVIVKDESLNETNFECIDNLWHPKSRWQVPRDGHFIRSEQGIADFLRPFINLGKELFLFDPYFSPTSHYFRDSLRAILKATERQPKTLEVHADCKDNRSTSQEWEKDCLAKLPDCVPKGWELTVVRWKRKDGAGLSSGPHQRFVLNELGGIGLDYGFQKGGKNDRSAYHLLTYKTSAQLKNEITNRENETIERPYDLVSEVCVVGTLT